MFAVYYQRSPQRRIPPLLVRYIGEEPRAGASGQVSITITAVPSDERRATMSVLEAELSTICEWIKAAEAAPMTWRGTGHELMTN